MSIPAPGYGIKEIYDSIQPRYPEFKGQVAIITGSSRGIGQGMALRLAKEGMKIDEDNRGQNNSNLPWTQPPFYQGYDR